MLLFQVEHILSKHWTLVFDGRNSDFQKRDLCWNFQLESGIFDPYPSL